MDYDQAFRDLEALANEHERDFEQAVADYLHGQIRRYSWVGIYWVDGSDLVLGAWKGPDATEHTRIPIGIGVCGAAAASGRAEIVADVSRDDRYLACFPSTKSEIVVPIFSDGTVIGEIDIDGTAVGAFGTEDQQFLERVAGLLSLLRRS